MGQLINQFIVYTVGGFHTAHRVIIYIKSLNVLLKVGDVRVSVSVSGLGCV